MNATKSRRFPQRSLNVVETQGNLTLVEVTESNSKSSKVGYYIVEPLPHDFGTAAYRLEKEDGKVYDVLLDDLTDNHTCDCPGHIQHGHRTRCKHVAALLILRERGKLPPSPLKPATPADERFRRRIEADFA